MIPPVAAVYLFENGMFMVFDEDGKQIADLQGPDSPELRALIKRHITPTTQWQENVKWPEDG